MAPGTCERRPAAKLERRQRNSAYQRLKGRKRTIGVVDPVGENAYHKILEGDRKIRTLSTDPRKIITRQCEKDRRPFRQHRGRAQGAAEETHFAHHRVRRDAPHAQIFAAARCDVDGERPGGNQFDAVGGFALPMQHGRRGEDERNILERYSRLKCEAADGIS